jgi:hypothetical protein
MGGLLGDASRARRPVTGVGQGRVGVFVNPMAGRDVRRLVARAGIVSGPEKTLAVARVIAGILGGDGVPLVLDDPAGIGRTAAAEHAAAILVPAPDTGDAMASASWVHALEAAGAAVLVSIGGDGTQRQVAAARPAVPVLPVAGGTNNVAAWVGDETAAGLAAAEAARGRLRGRVAKVIHVRWTRPGTSAAGEDLALVDVAFVRRAFVGAQAVWWPEDVRRLVLAVADPTRPGLSNAGGRLSPVAAGDDLALDVELDSDGEPVPGVVAPGLVETFSVARYRSLPLGNTVVWRSSEAGTLAFDGERAVMVPPGTVIRLTVRRDGPFVLDPGRILAPD